MSSLMQRILVALLPAGAAAAIEAESRQWRIECPSCGAGRSVWDAGGIRYKASGTARQRMRCGRCGQVGWNRLVKAGTGAPEG